VNSPGAGSPATRALRALLEPDAARPVLVAEAARAHVRVPGEVVTEAALARRLREEDVAVVVVHAPGPGLLRALRERPPALLVITGPVDADALPALADTLLLGPDARLRLEAGGDTVACATAPDELATLLATLAGELSAGTGELSAGTGDMSAGTGGRDLSAGTGHLSAGTGGRDLSAGTGGLSAGTGGMSAGTGGLSAGTGGRDLSSGTGDMSAGTGPSGVRLAACPTPSWWPLWLADRRLAGATAVGFVAADRLHPGWARWAGTVDAAATHVLVPLGLGPPRVDQPRHPSLAAGVAAHALERWTGPVFPSPQVLALLRRDARPVREDSRDPAALAQWVQARRALPLVGAAPGMEAPLPGLPLGSPTAAFIAQRALLRRAHSRALAQALPSGARDLRLDPAAIARAEEVLRGAGQVLSEHESKVVLRGFGVEITRQAVASSASGAAQFAETIGFPVVLKALSPDLRRRQELGAVVLGLTNGAAVRRAYATIVQNVEHNAPTAHLDGVLVAEQAPDGLEIQCGAVRLPGGEMAIHGCALGLPLAAEPSLSLSPLAELDALLLAHAVLARVPVPALRRASDPGVAELAGLFLRLDALVRHFEGDLSEGPDEPVRRDSRGDGRLISVELGPIRLVGPPRGYLTLDARIVQRAHLEGL